MLKTFAVDIDSQRLECVDYPRECPFCHHKIIPQILSGVGRINRAGIEAALELFMYCPDSTCSKSFIAYYYFDVFATHLWHYTGRVSMGTTRLLEFADSIKSISPNFASIYNEAFTAEQYGLKKICGVGYRKALEFLIKDYCSFREPAKKAHIEKMALGNCINSFISNMDIKDMASRAVWLGNDETHYVRIWETQDLDDLKTLLDLTIHWILMEESTREYKKRMPKT